METVAAAQSPDPALGLTGDSVAAGVVFVAAPAEDGLVAVPGDSGICTAGPALTAGRLVGALETCAIVPAGPSLTTMNPRLATAVNPLRTPSSEDATIPG